MLKDLNTTKKKASLLPDRRNKYSIRKFTVGTASILVGATLLFGVGTQDAKAAEQSTTSTEHAVTSNKDTKVEVNHADTVVNETAKTTSPEVVQKDVAKKDLKTTVEAPQETENQVSSEKTAPKEEASVSKQQDVSSEKAASKEENAAPKQPIVSPEKVTPKEEATVSKQQDVSSEKAALKEEGVTSKQPSVSPEKVAPKEETVAPKQQAVPTEKTTAENKAGVKQAVEEPKVKLPQPTLEIQQVKDLKTAAEFYAQSSGVSMDDAQALIKDLNLDSKATPKEIQQALINQLSRENKKWVKPGVRKDLTTEAERAANTSDFVKNAAKLPSDPEVIVADAIANGYISSTTDATNAKNTLSGRAWVVDKGTPATMSNGLTAVPQGTNVYMQWIDKDGAVSPVYTAKTTNELSKSGGSQVGPGAYAFDLREGWVDLNGTTHKYDATAGQDYRLWINDYQTAEGNRVTMLRQAGGFFPGTFVDSVTYSNLGQFPLIGTNMQRTGIFMAVIPTSGYMEKDKADQIHDTAGPINSPAVNLSAKNSVSGKVWLETGAGDYANSATGPNDNEADPQAEGYTVVMSSLTPEGAKAYDEAISDLPENQKSDATKALLEKHPEYISATVYGETDKDGRYTLRFPDGTLNASHMYGYVKKPSGDIVNTYSSFTSPQFRAPNANLSWAPQTAPAQNLVANPMWYNVNFAAIPTADLTIDILHYNTTTTPAVPGSNVDIELPGTTMSPLPTHIEWRDEKGNVLAKTPEFKTIEEGEKLGKFQVPTDAKSGDIYTAYLVTGGNDVSADSLIVQTYAEVYEPTAQPIEKPFGTPTTVDEVKGKVSVPNFPADKGTPVVTVDDSTKVPNGQTSGTFDVPVTVTYPDGSQDKTTVKVTVDPKDSDTYEAIVQPIEKPFGTPTTVDEVKGKVSVPNFPADKGTPVVTVDDSTKVPNGQTSGTFDVPVTVTYPDGTKDYVTVKVTVDPKESDTYEPVVQPIEKPYGQSTTEQEVKDKVTVPNFPADKGTPLVTVDDPAKVPNGQTSGEFDIPVTVTYPDGTKDHVTVKVTVGNQADNVKYAPQAGELTKSYGQPTTTDEVKGKVTVPGYPENGQPYTVTVDNTKLPNGQTSGTFEVPVTVTYPDKTTDTVNVKVTVSPKDSDTYEPVVQPIEKPYGQSTTEQEVKNTVTVPNFPADKGTPVVTVDDPAKVPNGQTSGEFDVPVTVTYPDGTKDHVTVKVTVGNQADNVKYEPQAGELTKPYGQPTTANEVKDKVTVPGYPENEKPYTVIVDNPSILPNGQTPGNYEVPVTVTYPDGTKDNIKVKITVHPQLDGDIYNPGYNNVTVNPGQSIEVPQVKDKVPTGTHFEIPKGSGVDKDWKVTVSPDTGIITVTAPKDAVEGHVVTVPVQVTYPDGSKDHVTVNVTVHDSIAPEAPVVNPIEAGDKTVTGTGKEPDTTVTVTFPDGSAVSTKVGKAGKWKVDVPSTVKLKVGDSVKAVITDKAGNVSKETVTSVKDTVAPNAPIVNGIHTGDKVITGTAESGTTVKVTFPNGKKVSVKVGQEGTWSLNAPSDVTLRTGDKVTAVAIDEAGNVSKSTTAIVVGDKENTNVSTNHTDTNKQSTQVEVAKVRATSSNKTARKAQSTANALPDTGEDTPNSGTLFGGLFATLGAFLLFRRRRTHNDNK